MSGDGIVSPDHLIELLSIHNACDTPHSEVLYKTTVASGLAIHNSLVLILHHMVPILHHMVPDSSYV